MPQDGESGGRAARWGRETSRRIGKALGAGAMVDTTSNECVWDGKRVVIKTAGAGTNSVGVTYQMLDRLDEVLAAFAVDEDAFEVWSLTPAQYRDAMRPTRSRGPSAGRVGLVRRDVFEKKGRLIRRVVLT